MPKNKILQIVAAVILVLVAAGIFFLGKPAYQEYNQTATDLEIKKIQVKQKEEYFSKLKDLQAKLQNYNDQFAKINAALPSEISLPALFNFIQRLSLESGVILKEIKGGTPSSSSIQGATGVQTFSFPLGLSGSYSSFKNFLSNLYQNSRIIDVDTVKFSSPKEGAKTELFEFNLDLKTYYSSAETEEGSSARPVPKLMQ